MYDIPCGGAFYNGQKIHVSKTDKLSLYVIQDYIVSVDGFEFITSQLV